MKRTIFYTALVLAVLFVGAITLWHGSSNLKNPTTPNASSTIARPFETNAPIDSARISTQGSKQIEDKFGIKPNMTPEEIKQKVADWYLKQGQKLAAHDQHPIMFYGKTVDESNQPLAGVNVHFSLNGGLVEKDLYSDASGNFYISDLVGKLLIIDVSRAGYYSSKSCHAMFDYTTYQPNPLQPEIFSLQKKGPGVALISAVLNVQIPRDGTPVYVDFFNKHFGENGQVQMSQIKPPYESWKKATSWSFKIGISDGGFVEESEEFPFEAPTSGYQSTIIFDFKADQPNWKTNLKKSYYIIFGTPPRYGRIDIENDIMWNGAHISYAINPEGSRYLEPKSDSK